MKRPYLLYLLAVVLPSAMTIAAGVRSADHSWEAVRRQSESRAARTALSAFHQDLGAEASALQESVRPTVVTDSSDALHARALAGESANGLVPTSQGIEVRVALPPLPGDPPGTVRQAAGPLPSSAIAVGRTAGYRTALYLGGRRWMATEPPPGPEYLDTATLQALTRSTEGVPVPTDTVEGTLVTLPRGAGSPAIAVLVAPHSVPPSPLAGTLLLVMGLLLVFASLAGWILLTGAPRATGRVTVVLLALVPALSAWGFLIHGDRLFHLAMEDAGRKDLARALAAVRVRGVADDPVAVHALSGFHAYRVREGRVEAASREGSAEAVAALPAPPPSFTSTGKVLTPEGTVRYVALRLPAGGFTVAVAPPTGALHDVYGTPARRAGVALAGWLLLVAAVLVGRRREASSLSA